MWRKSAIRLPWRRLRKGDDRRLVPGGAQELQQAGAGKASGAGVDEGVKVQPLAAQHRRIERYGHAAGPVVDRALHVRLYER